MLWSFLERSAGVIVISELRIYVLIDWFANINVMTLLIRTYRYKWRICDILRFGLVLLLRFIKWLFWLEEEAFVLGGPIS